MGAHTSRRTGVHNHEDTHKYTHGCAQSMANMTTTRVMAETRVVALLACHGILHLWVSCSTLYSLLCSPFCSPLLSSLLSFLLYFPLLLYSNPTRKSNIAQKEGEEKSKKIRKKRVKRKGGGRRKKKRHRHGRETEFDNRKASNRLSRVFAYPEASRGKSFKWSYSDRSYSRAVEA